MNFLGSLGFGSLSQCETAVRAGLAFWTACQGCPAWGEDTHTRVQAHPKFRAIWPILPQFLLPGEQGRGLPERPQTSGDAPARCW